MLGVSIGLWDFRQRAGYAAEATALFDAMSVQPNETRKGHIDTLIAALKAGGIWSKLDLLYLTAAHDAQAARLNWKAPGSFALTPANNPTFLTDRHYAGDGISMHLATGFTPSTHAQQMAQNSASLGVWCRNNTTGTFYDIGTAATSTLRLNSRASSLFNGRLNTGTTVTATLPSNTSAGYTACDRASSSQVVYYRNGTGVAPVASTSAALETSEVYLLRDESTYSNRQLAAAWLGGSLFAGEHAAFDAALNTYLTALGAA